MIPKHIENRLNRVIEKIRRQLTTCKTFIVRSKAERKKILENEKGESKKYGELIEVSNIIVIINCEEYDGKERRKKK